MANHRTEILTWAQQERISARNLPAALALAGVLPTAAGWRRFLDRLLLFMGVVLLAAGVIFFLAFNWRDLGRFAKFGLGEAPLLAVLVFVWHRGLDGFAGKAALLLAALLAGALLALVGQTYQTGADTFELFALWAAAILPWVFLARFPALWILWLVLVNLAVSLYFTTIGWWEALMAPATLGWVLFGLNTAALMVWEFLWIRGTLWLRERWAARLLATASGGAITGLAVRTIFDFGHQGPWGLIAWLLWLVAAYAVYRRRFPDLFVLAAGVLSVVVVAAALLGKISGLNFASTWLLTGLVIIGLSAAGGYWLKQIAQEEKT